MRSPKNHPQVSTLALFGYLTTVMSWEFNIGLVLLEVYSPKKPGLIILAVLFVISICLTSFSIARGKRDFAQLGSTRGRIELTGTQAILITVFMILFGGTIGMVAMNIANQ